MQHRSAEELLPYAEAALGSEGRAVVDPGTNSLVLFARAPGAAAQRARAARRAGPRPAHGGARVPDAARERARERGPSRRLGGGQRAGADREPDRPGGRLPRARRPARRARPRELEPGEHGPHPRGPFGADRHRRDRCPHHAPSARERRPRWFPADSGLEAHARVLGDGRVLLELRPFEARFRGDGRIETAEAVDHADGRAGQDGGDRGAEQRTGSRQPGCPHGSRARAVAGRALADDHGADRVSPARDEGAQLRAALELVAELAQRCGAGRRRPRRVSSPRARALRRRAARRPAARAELAAAPRRARLVDPAGRRAGVAAHARARGLAAARGLDAGTHRARLQRRTRPSAAPARAGAPAGGGARRAGDRAPGAAARGRARVSRSGCWRSSQPVFGAGLERELAALREPAPLDLRVNTLAATREQALRSLSRAGRPGDADPVLAGRAAAEARP